MNFRKTLSLCLAMPLIGLLISCHKNNKNETQEDPSFKRATEWKITYTGSRLETEENGTSKIYEDCKIEAPDTCRYISWAYTMQEYENYSASDPKQLAEKTLQQFKERMQYENKTVDELSSTGNSTATFGHLSTKGLKCIIIVAGITDEMELSGKYNALEFTVTGMKTTENANWNFKYEGTDPNGNHRIKVNPPSNRPYFVALSHENDIDSYFGGNLEEYFEGYLSTLYYKDEITYDLSSEYYVGEKEIAFQNLDPGKWTAYAFCTDENGKFIGEYSKFGFEVKGDNKVSGFDKWLGYWKLYGDNVPSDHLKRDYSWKRAKVTYYLKITKGNEDNRYKITGWQCDPTSLLVITRCLYAVGKFEEGSGNMILTTEPVYTWIDFGHGVKKHETFLYPELVLDLGDNVKLGYTEEIADIASTTLSKDGKTGTMNALTFGTKDPDYLGHTITPLSATYIMFELDDEGKQQRDENGQKIVYGFSNEGLMLFPAQITYMGPLSHVVTD